MTLEQYFDKWVQQGWLTEELVATVVLLIAGAAIVAGICFLLQLIASWRVFTKAGEKGWKILIPLYNGHVLFKIIWKPALWWIMLIASVIPSFLIGTESILGMIVSLACTVVYLVLYIKGDIKLAQAFGRGTGFAIGLIFLPTIFTMILAFGKSQYIGQAKKAMLEE